jgi:ABC-2 type transport system ATP-binding protein
MKATISRKTITFYSKESIPTKLLKELPNVTEVQSNEGRFTLTTEDTDATLQAIYQRSLPVTDVLVERGSLDEAFEQFVANQEGEIA